MKFMRPTIILSWLLFSFSFVVYAQPPIEVIYLKPSDIFYSSREDIDFVHDIMIEVQAFFASEMDRYGFGPKTFDFDSDIKIVRGKQKAEYYDSAEAIQDETFQLDYDTQNKIVVVFLAGKKNLRNKTASGFMKFFCWQWPGAASHPDDCNYLGVIALDNPLYILPTTAHEIAHAFKISHSSNTVPNRVNLMNPPHTIQQGVKETLDKYGIRYTDAAFLNESGRLTIQQNLQASNQVIDADVNNDNRIDLADVELVRQAMQNSILYDTDINNDGITNEIDLLIVKAKAHEAITQAAPALIRRTITSWGQLKRR